MISKPQKETEFTGSDLSSIYYDENKSKVNKHEKSKAKSVKEYLKIAEQSLASDEKEEAVEAYNSALELKPASLICDNLKGICFINYFFSTESL